MIYDITSREDVEDIIFSAHTYSAFSTCLKKKVGATLFSLTKKNVVGSGFGHPEVPCKECVRKSLKWSQDGCWSIHAELDAIFNHFKNFGFQEDLSDCIMFTTHGPCDQCLKYMNRFKIQLVVYDVPYHNDYSKWKGRINVMDATEFIKMYCISKDNQLRLPI